MNDFDIEEAPSNRTYCYKCSKQLEKGTLRVNETYPSKYGHRSNYFCLECGRETLLNCIEEANIQLVKLNKIIKNHVNTQ